MDLGLLGLEFGVRGGFDLLDRASQGLATPIFHEERVDLVLDGASRDLATFIFHEARVDDVVGVLKWGFWSGVWGALTGGKIPDWGLRVADRGVDGLIGGQQMRILTKMMNIIMRIAIIHNIFN